MSNPTQTNKKNHFLYIDMAKGKRIHVYIPEELDRKLEQLSKRGKIKNKSSFVEKAIEEKIYKTLKIEKDTLKAIRKNKKPTETPEQYIKRIIDNNHDDNL